MKTLILCAGLSLVAMPALAQSDAQIRQAIIAASIASYSGSCPCPYSINRAGRACGPSSAYSKPGGASPVCYPQDVTADMIRRYRELAGR